VSCSVRHSVLVFATRRLIGLTTFREIERQVTPVQQTARAHAKQRRRPTTTGQLEFLSPTEMDTDYFESLCTRYRQKARAALEASLPAVGSEVSYDALIPVALAWPMTSDTELKEWLANLASAGRIELRGLGPRERVPKVGAGHTVYRVR
jgi:hypothetical protein